MKISAQEKCYTEGMDEPQYPQSDFVRASEAMHRAIDELLRVWLDLLTPAVTWLAKRMHKCN